MVEKKCTTLEFNELIKALVGLTVSLTWKGYGSAIFLELGELLPVKRSRQNHDRGEGCIAIEWDWRVEGNDRVLFGSSNNGPEIQSGIESLLGAKITSVALSGRVPELVVHFSNKQCLRSMVMVTGDPEWSVRLLNSKDHIYSRAGELFIGGGALELTKQEQKAFDVAKITTSRWGVPKAEPMKGHCADCAWLVRLDGNADFLDYGVCTSGMSPFDGRVVMRKSGCPSFVAED